MTATFDPAISSEEDADSLAELGYTQELHRGIGGYAAFASGFSFVSILTTVFALFALGFGLGGPAFFFTWPIVFVCQFCVCLVFAELSGQVPRRRRHLSVVAPAGRQRGRLVRRLVHADRLHRQCRGAGDRDAERAAVDLERLSARRRRPAR